MTNVRFRACLLVAGVIVTLSGFGDRSAPRAQSAGGDAVSVSFLAVGRDGKPVLDLKADEVQLRVDGKQRTLKSLDRIDAPAAAAGDRGKAAGPAPAPPYGSNMADGGGAATGSGGRQI